MFQYRVPLPEEQFPTVHGIRQFYEALVQSIEIVHNWVEKVPGFCDLRKDDQEILFKSAALEIVVLRMAYRYSFIHSLIQPTTCKSIHPVTNVPSKLRARAAAQDLSHPRAAELLSAQLIKITIQQKNLLNFTDQTVLFILYPISLRFARRSSAH